MAAPAPAREIVRASTEFSATSDAVAGGRVSLAMARELRIAELRRQIQAGSYQVDCELVSASIIRSCLSLSDPYQR